MDTNILPKRTKPATDAVVSGQADFRASLDFDDAQDFDDVKRGFLGTIAEARIVNAKGRAVWTLEPYRFLERHEAPDEVNASLWRQSLLNMHHGLFEVVPGAYQIRGFDIANMTILETDSGIVVVDTLSSIEGAQAGLALYRQHRGDRPVKGVIITHTHADHWSGVKGVLSEAEIVGGIPIIAPDLFMEHAVSENVIAGPAMYRRALYQFGHFLKPGERGHVDCGLGKTISSGKVALVAPNDFIKATGDRRVIDGLELIFQMAPNSEAPAEMHFYAPRYKLLNLAENRTHNFHNLLPFRGAEVRDALLWSKYLSEALRTWGKEAEVLCGQHHWPVWGRDKVALMIRQQRDLYKYAHDQTVRLMNHGMNAGEIAEALQVPKSLAQAWHTRGYYGHIRHNVKAIYQKYLGWYDANPANLDPLARTESGKKFVEYMGGADAVLERARADFTKGEFRFVAQALSCVVFAQSDHEGARELLADTFEQLGFLAESATWRNAYLVGAQELREGLPSKAIGHRLPPETVRGLRTEQIWDVLGVRLNPERVEGQIINLTWHIADTDEHFTLTLENCALTYAPYADGDDPDAIVFISRATLNAVISKAQTLEAAIADGLVRIEGDKQKLLALMDSLDEFSGAFGISAPT